MKGIVEKINESSSKYVIEYSKNGERNSIFSNNYKKTIDELIQRGLDLDKNDYYTVFDNSKSNFSEVDSIVEFSGENNPMYAHIKYSENPSSMPKYWKGLRKSEIEKLKSKYKEF